MSYGCQQNLIARGDPELIRVLEYLCSESNKVYNCSLYYARQLYLKTRHIANKAEICTELSCSKNRHFKAMYVSSAQQTCIAVAEAMQSFKSLKKLYEKGQLSDKPSLPKYRKQGLYSVTYPKKWLKVTELGVRLPLGRQVKAWFGLEAIYLKPPTNLDWGKVKELRILPRNGAFYAEYVYQKDPVAAEPLDPDKVLGIDHGIDNWLTCVSNVGTSFIVDGRHLKSLNQWYNKRVSQLQERKPQDFWSKQLGRITERRNRQVRDAVNKTARLVVNHCVEHQIGKVVFGWNKGQKREVNLGGKTNQKFVQIPTGRLKERIKQLCEEHGIEFFETEESYTSKASYLDQDFLPTYGEKPDGWKPSGQRVARGLYKTKAGHLVNADANGAANIIQKVAKTLGLCLEGLGRGALTTPLRTRIWVA